MLDRAEDAVRRTAAVADEAEREVWQRLGRGGVREVKDS
jgi:hypothetical protein